MSLWSEMSDDAAEFLETFGRPIVFRGVSFYGMVSRAPVEQMLQDGGMTYHSAYQVRIHAPEGSSYTTNKPTQGEFITVFGARYTILAVTNRPPSPWIDLTVSLSSSA